MSRKRLNANYNDIVLLEVRQFESDHPIDEVLDYYRQHQVVIIKKAVLDHSFSINDIRKVHAEDSDIVDETFSMEAKKSELGWGSHSSSDLFGQIAVKSGQWYASFIAQKKVVRGTDTILSKSYESFKEKLPLSTLPLEGSELKIKYTAPIWVFAGQNDQENTFLRGRPEHIDSVNHDGTWHLQSSGTKVWYIRPADTKEWGDKPVRVSAPEVPTKKRKSTQAADETESNREHFMDGLGRLKVVVEKGDILIINTRVWWHQTRIPFTGSKDYSISYAIDFFAKDLRLPGSKELDQTTTSKMKRSSNGEVDEPAEDADGLSDESGEDEEDEEGQEYSNIDGLYASKALKSGEVVFYESELPDCALPRSDDPSCEIVWLEDGSGALFALKDLSVGDWLTVAPSDDEDSDEDDEDSDDEEGSDGDEGDEGDSDDEECCEEGSGDDEDEDSDED